MAPGSVATNKPLTPTSRNRLNQAPGTTHRKKRTSTKTAQPAKKDKSKASSPTSRSPRSSEFAMSEGQAVEEEVKDDPVSAEREGEEDKDNETFEDAHDTNEPADSETEAQDESLRRSSLSPALEQDKTDSPQGTHDNAAMNADEASKTHESHTGQQGEAEAMAALNSNVGEEANGTETPSLTSFRISTIEDGNSQTGGSTAADSTPHIGETSPVINHDSIPNLAPNTQASDGQTLPMKGLSGDLPAVDYPPPPNAHGKPLAVPREQTTRKTSNGPFSWFSRATSGKKPSSSPPRQTQPSGLAARRGTASSMATLGSNDGLGSMPEMADGSRSPGRPHRDSLKDRFQMVRQQEESSPGGEPRESQDSRIDRAGSMQSPTTGEPVTTPPMVRASSASAVPTSINTKLPPGTASGMSVGPGGDEEAPVNWDLWQDLVNEGPSAVARTSGTELSNAIASGIPQPIRGVVWQVLAQSKNQDLEAVYRELVARGPEQERPTLPLRESGNGNNEKESLASSASSIHSQHSTQAPSTMPTSPMPSIDQGGFEGMSSIHETLSVEKVKRNEKEAVNLQKLEKAIKRDLGARTSYSRYLSSAGLQDGLFGICKAYALYDEAVGYAQGMNFIAMPLLFNMPEEEAFTLFVRLMNKYDLRSLFTADMAGLHLRLYQFERLLEDNEPALYCHLHRKGVSPLLYATQWFLTLFAYRFPLQLVLRIYDLILSEGLSAILKFGIVLMQKNAQTLLAMKDMSHLTTHLKEKLFDVYIDKSPSASSLLESGFFGSASGVDKEVYHADALVRDACAIEVSPETLGLYSAEFEERQRTEREREHELETLRSSNSTLSSRIRNLEERAQQHDMEHVGIASDLVRTKVENQTLVDANESLKIQVEELRRVVESQPAEVEQRLNEEMQRIMARNIEVQNQNRSLEDAMQEMEQELVTTKMNHATLNGDHDELKQKLSSIQAMLSS